MIGDRMISKIQYCRRCNCIIPHWNEHTKKWNAPYADGGIYCECSTEELKKFETLDKRFGGV